MRFRLDGVVTVVDAVNGAATLDAHAEAVKQAAVADRIVLTKTDLIDTPERRDALAALRARLAAVNPAAPVIEAANASVPQLIDSGLYDPDRKIPDVKRWLADEAYAPAQRISPFASSSRRKPPRCAHPRLHAGERTRDLILGVRDFLDLVRAMHGPNLLRVKGIVKIAEAPDAPIVITACSTCSIRRNAFRMARCRPPHAAGVHRQRHRPAPDRGSVQRLFGKSADRQARRRGAERQSAGSVRRRGSFALKRASRPTTPCLRSARLRQGFQASPHHLRVDALDRFRLAQIRNQYRQ